MSPPLVWSPRTERNVGPEASPRDAFLISLGYRAGCRSGLGPRSTGTTLISVSERNQEQNERRTLHSDIRPAHPRLPRLSHPPTLRPSPPPPLPAPPPPAPPP